jgi:hypothetical protein
VTLAIYPGTTCDTSLKFLENVNPDTHAAWLYLVFETIYNIFDTIGRWFGG